MTSTLLVLGANGPSGRECVRQALDRGCRVDALTRHPAAFPARHDRLRVIGGDATDPGVVDRAVRGADAVVSVIGAAFTRRPVEVYSTSARLVVDAMLRHRKQRFVAVTSASLTPVHGSRLAPGALLRTAMRRTIGRTVYDDMASMEALVSASDLRWTIVRPPGLVSEPGVGYAAAETEAGGPLCSREDLAGMLLDQVDSERFVRKVAGVASPGLRVGAWYMIRHEILKR